MKLNRYIIALAVALSLAGGAVSVAALSRSGPTQASSPAADRAVLAANIEQASGSFYRPYTRLVDFLPNAKDQDGLAATDSVVVGTVSAVDDNAGYDETGEMPTPGHPGARVTRFDDPRADWRTLRVTIDVEETLSGPKGPQLEISWGLMGNSATGVDKTAIARALKDLGRIAVFSRALPTGPEYLGIVRKVPDRQYGVAVVASDGALSFPFLGSEPASATAQTTFKAGIDTLPELRAEAAKPEWTRAPG